MTEPALVCRDTGQRFSIDEPLWRAPGGGLLDVEWPVRPDPAKWRGRGNGVWRYREMIPIREDASIVSVGEGGTPLISTRFDGRQVGLKLDHLFPTGSFKDRGATVLISKARELGVKRVVEDSSGNAGAAIAAYCARAGIECEIFCPASASRGKLDQIRLFGARLKPISGSREDVASAALQAATSVYYASHCWNPFFFHGVKTIAYEIAEQRGWRLPQALLMPVGNGTLLLGAYIGFQELAGAGLIDRIPRLIGVQAENCAPLAAMERGATASTPTPTMAEGIAVAKPVRARQILAAIAETSGCLVTVSEEEVRAALREALSQGLCIEPTSAAALAAIRHDATQYDDILVVVTGHGLKSVDKLVALALLD